MDKGNMIIEGQLQEQFISLLQLSWRPPACAWETQGSEGSQYVTLSSPRWFLLENWYTVETYWWRTSFWGGISFGGLIYAVFVR